LAFFLVFVSVTIVDLAFFSFFAKSPGAIGLLFPFLPHRPGRLDIFFIFASSPGAIGHFFHFCLIARGD
jgi:hypothetical protein